MVGRASRLAVPAAAVAVGALGALAVASGTPGASGPATSTARALPRPVKPAFVPGAPRPLGSARHLSSWAPVRRAVFARQMPSSSGTAVAGLGTRTPEGTANLVSVIGRRTDAAARVWVQVRLPVLPNGTTGWVPRRALGGYETVDTRLDVDLRRLRATLYRRGRRVFAANVGVGAPGWETPRGTFYVRNRLTRYRSGAYGPVAFGTSARSPQATDWPAGGFIGIHGTDRPDLVPGRVSHGCIRLRNPDVLALSRRMPVGTPVTIR